MKNNLTLLLVFGINLLLAQAPAQFKYQAALRDGDGNVLAGKTTSVMIEILQASTTGQVVFSETHNVTTTEQGIINIVIGSVNPNQMLQVDWSAGPYFIRMSVNGTEMGISQMLSVPYAIHSKYSEASDFNSLENKPAFFSGSYNDLTNKPVLFSGSYNDLSNKPTPAVKISDLTLDASDKKIINLASPINPTDAANKQYVDMLLDKLLSLQAEMGVKDLENNSYAAVKIGTQVWMAENLKSTSLNDGTPIALVTDNTAWGAAVSPAYSWYNNDETTYKSEYGALYNWYTVNTGKLCPAHWHVPTREDWMTLINYLGGSAIAGGKMKEVGAVHWTSPNTGADNTSGFSALPGGTRSGDSVPDFAGIFGNIGDSGVFWTATAFDANFVYFIALSATAAESYTLNNFFKRHGASVRCIHD